MPTALSQKVTTVFPSELGWMAVAWENDALDRLTFGNASAAAASRKVGHDDPGGELNPLSAEMSDVVERLQQGLADFEASLRSGRLAELPPLDEILLTGLE